MAFGFMGEDLEQIETQKAFADVVDVISEIDPYSDTLLLFTEDANFLSWIENDSATSGSFLHFCSEHESPHIRILAMRLADNWIGHDTELAIDVIEKSLGDRDEKVVARATSFIRDFLTEDVYETTISELTITQIARIARAYRDTTVSRTTTSTQ